MDHSEPWLDWAVELQSIAQAGLYYGKDRFDRERYPNSFQSRQVWRAAGRLQPS